MVSAQVRPKSKDEAEEGLWSSMLNSVATGKRLPEKNLLILGPFIDYKLANWEIKLLQEGRQRHKENFWIP